MMDIQWWGIPAVPLIMAVVELLKQVGLPPKWAGVAAAIVGVLGGLAAWGWGYSDAAQAAVTGLLAGLMASGIWSTTKNAMEGWDRGTDD